MDAMKPRYYQYKLIRHIAETWRVILAEGFQETCTVKNELGIKFSNQKLELQRLLNKEMNAERTFSNFKNNSKKKLPNLPGLVN